MSDTALTTATAQPDANPLAFLYDGDAFNHLWRVAKTFSLSGMVPEAYQNKPEACLVALMYAQQLGEHPMLMFQEMAPLKGKPNTSAKFAIARANKSGLLRGPIMWETTGSGDALVVTAKATMRETGETIAVPVSMQEAKADGWDRNPKYRTMPEQMLRWRSATRLINLYIPQVLFGMAVREEAEVQRVQVAETAAASGDTIADLNRQIAAAPAAPVAAAVAVVEAEVVDAAPAPAPAAAAAPAARVTRRAAPAPAESPLLVDPPEEDGMAAPFGDD